MSKPEPLTEIELGSFLHRFRYARYSALEDAENFTDICFLIEELGCRLVDKKLTLNDCKAEIMNFCRQDENEELFVTYELLRESRNDKSHKGVYARSSTHRALKVCIAIEEIIVSQLDKQGVKYLMTENPIFAQDFFSVSKLRETILENSFSYLPYLDSKGKFRLISDLETARVWKTLTGSKSKYIESFLKHIEVDKLPEAGLLGIEDSVEKAIQELRCTENRPLIVIDAEKRVRGILTAFDLL